MLLRREDKAKYPTQTTACNSSISVGYCMKCDKELVNRFSGIKGDFGVEEIPHYHLEQFKSNLEPWAYANCFCSIECVDGFVTDRVSSLQEQLSYYTEELEKCIENYA